MINGEPASKPSRISSFDLSMPSREPRFSICDTPIFVIIASVGLVAVTSR